MVNFNKSLFLKRKTANKPDAIKLTINSLAWIAILLFLCQNAFADPTTYTEENLSPLLDQFFKSQPMMQPYANQTQIQLNPLGSRPIKLSCDHEPKFQLPNNQSLRSRMTLYATCQSPTAWKVTLPISVSIEHDILVTQQALHKGETLTKEHLLLRPVDILTLNEGFFDSSERLIGYLAKTHLAAGQVLTTRNTEAPKMIKRGEQVLISVKKPGFQVKMKGKSLEDGYLGNSIKVENLNSKRIIEGIVTQNREVEVFI